MSDQDKRQKNLRTALWLAALALFFFVMLFVKRIWLS
jgi:hypothetical protein